MMSETRNEIESVAYERIVVPLDGSALAERALPHARTLARAIRAPIHLLRIVDITPLTELSVVGPGPEPTAVFAELDIVQTEEEAATDYLEKIRQQLNEQGLDATVEVRTGLVKAELVDAVQPRDLVVMTTHGRTGLERLFFGSVAEEMIKHSVAPVLLARSSQAPTETAQSAALTSNVGRD
jgi:nucleotide-binding universal stress UspA family protein